MSNPRGLPTNTRQGVYEGGTPVPRIYHRKARGRRDPRYLVKCGDCEGGLEIYYDGNELEIGGVLATKETWAEILLPLLRQTRRRAGGRS